MRLFVRCWSDAPEPSTFVVAAPPEAKTVRDLLKTISTRFLGHGEAMCLRMVQDGFSLLAGEPVRLVLKDNETIDVFVSSGELRQELVKEASISSQQPTLELKPALKRPRVGLLTESQRLALFGRTEAELPQATPSASSSAPPEGLRGRKRKLQRSEPEIPSREDLGPKEKSRAEAGLTLVGDLAPAGTGWEYPLRDERRRCFSGFLPAAISSDIAEKLLEASKEGARWRQPNGTWGPIPRKTSWMTSAPCTCRYGYGGLRVKPEPFQPWVREAMDCVMPLCGYSDPKDWPDSCNLNLYEDGGHSVGWHADDEHLFLGKVQDCLIISLSLGATRSFDLKALEEPEVFARLQLKSGDLCTMEGLTQRHYWHRVPKESETSPRVNLTWRWIKSHQRGCPLGPAVLQPPLSAQVELPNKRRKRAQAVDSPAPGPEKSPAQILKEVLALGPPARTRWLAAAFKAAAAGSMSTGALFIVLTDAALSEGVPETLGKRMYRLLRANLHLFDAGLQGVLQDECELAKAFKNAVTAEAPDSAAAATPLQDAAECT